MKWLDYPELDSLSTALTFESAECKVFTRIEAYSCKTVSKERRLLKSLESQYAQAASSSPPAYLEEAMASPFGRLDQPGARKTLFLLIATLNGAFPDHDFSQVNPATFRRESSSDSVLNSLSTTLLSLRSSSNAPRSFSSFPSSYDESTSRSMPTSKLGGMMLHQTFPQTMHINHPQLNSVLDDIMCIPECEVFSFHPDFDSDPHACAEPDEEGDAPDDRYADDGDDEDIFSDEDDFRMNSKRDSVEIDDTPMFDEDLFSGGFHNDGGSTYNSSQPTTPRTPTSTRVRTGESFSGGHKGSSSLKRRSGPGLLSTSMSSSSDSSDIYDDGQEGPNGLLWDTYTFFYNRKLKRILFVSVWSRANPGMAGISFSPPKYQTGYTTSASVPVRTSVTIEDSADEITPNPSPVKRALARASTGRGVGKGNHRRATSGSPAPSALSPFPHASPQATGRQSIVGHNSSTLASASSTMANLDGIVTSTSAPSGDSRMKKAYGALESSTEGNRSSASPPLSSSVKRSGETAHVGGETRKQRRVAKKSSGKPVIA